MTGIAGAWLWNKQTEAGKNGIGNKEKYSLIEV